MKRLHQTDWEEGQAPGSFSMEPELWTDESRELNDIRNGGRTKTVNRQWTRISTRR